MRKLLEKFLTILLAMSMVLSACFTMASCQSDPSNDEQKQEQATAKVSPINIGVLADIHLFAEADIEAVDSFLYKWYFPYFGVTRDINLSEAILKTAVDELLRQKPDVVFAVGDLTENGSFDSLNVVKEQLTRLQNAGIPVFVTNGKCDIDSCISIKFNAVGLGVEYIPTPSSSEFVEMFKDFGYGNAASKDADTLSYLADIPGTDYSVLALDDVVYDGTQGFRYNNNALVYGFSEATINWIESALFDAEKRGKTVLVTTNTPLRKLPTDLFTDFNVGMYRYVTNGNRVEALITAHGVSYVFQGELHLESTKKVTTENGELCEFTTSCLCAYPSYVKTFKIDTYNNITESKETLPNIKESYIPSYVSSEVKTAATTDYKSYVKKYFRESFAVVQQNVMYHKGRQNAISDFTPRDTERNFNHGQNVVLSILKELELYHTGDSQKDGEYIAIAEDITDWMLEVDNMQLYGVSSVESFCKEKNIPMAYYPEYVGKTTNDYVIDLFYKMLDGTYVSDTDGSVTQMFTAILCAGLYKAASIDVFGRLNALNDKIRSCDISVMLDSFFETDIADFKKDGLILTLVSLFYQYFENHVPWLKLNFDDMDAFLKGVSVVVDLITVSLPELALFLPNGELETSYCNIEKGLIYGEPFMRTIMMQVLSRTVVKI